MALRDRVDPRRVAAVVRGELDALPEEVRLAVRFTRAALDRTTDAGELREEIVRRWGRRALISLAFAMTAARLYPTLKYVLGHGEACRKVVVAGEPVAVLREVA
jgi:hypothetical protein